MINFNYRNGMGGFNKTFISVLLCLLFLVVFFAYQRKCYKKMADLWTLPQPDCMKDLMSMPTSVTVTSILRRE